MTQLASILASIGALALASTAAAIEPTAQAIEYYNASLNHYFVTAFPEEAAMLDAGSVVKGPAIRRRSRCAASSARRVSVPIRTSTPRTPRSARS